LNSWAQLGIGDFTLGMPRQQVMDILHRHFPSVELEHNLSYPVPMPYYRARTVPSVSFKGCTDPYRSGLFRRG
jgi:hypothetical protein